MELADELKSLLIDTAKQLKGSARRQFMVCTVKALGPGGASRVEREFGWNRKTIRKGMHEVESGITCLDAFREAKRLKYPGECDILQTTTVWRESMELTDALKSLLIDTAKQLNRAGQRG